MTQNESMPTKIHALNYNILYALKPQGLVNTMKELISFAFQLAINLDRVVSGIRRKPLKILVQVNTSGEACE